jgi:PilZ domain
VSYPKRKESATFHALCLIVSDIIKNRAESISPDGNFGDKLQRALNVLGVQEEEFYQFLKESDETCLWDVMPLNTPVRAANWFDRRESRRETRETKAIRKILLALPKPAQGRVSEISMSGCTLQTEMLMQLGQVIDLKLYISNDPIMIDSLVIRNTSANRAGVEFLRFGESERKRLQFFIRQERCRNDLKDSEIKQGSTVAA